MVEHHFFLGSFNDVLLNGGLIRREGKKTIKKLQAKK